MPKTFIPQDWKILRTSPSGLELTFTNDKTGESTWYTPQGMTSAEILAIPGAKKHWGSTEQVEEYIKKMAQEKARSGGQDINSGI